MGGVGSSEIEGYVEAFNATSGQWGGICDNNFDFYEAHVVCKMLGFPTALQVFANSIADNLYGTSPSGSNFILDNLDCAGCESSIFDCPRINEFIETCVASKIAAVKCSTSKL